MRRGGLLLAGVAFACSKPTPNGAVVASSSAPSSTASTSSVAVRAATTLASKAFPLPDASAPVTLDMLAYDGARGQVWIPVGEGGSVDVFTVATKSFARVRGFETQERETHGRKRMMGPSSAAVGDGFVYVGDRASSQVCAVSDTTLEIGKCATLASPPDVVGYDDATKEIWATTPKQSSISVLDASDPADPKPKLVVKTDGSPECWALDTRRSTFWTNLEDKNRVVAIDTTTHAVKSTWALDCNERGPRGVAVDVARDFVFVACADHVEVLDAGHGGARVGTLDAGAGVDAIDYDESAKTLYVAAGKSARLTVATFSDAGVPSVVATASTANGARNAVVDSSGAAYVVDPQTARLLVFAPPR